jgi:hypothetical protein
MVAHGNDRTPNLAEDDRVQLLRGGSLVVSLLGAFGHLLHRAGLRRVRPKHTLEGKRDEVAHARAKRLGRLGKQAQHGGEIVISQDETELHLFPPLTAVWAVVGSPQPKVATPGKNQKRVLYGGLDLRTGSLTTHWAPT